MIKLITIAIIGLIIYVIFEIGFWIGSMAMFSYLVKNQYPDIERINWKFSGGHLRVKNIITKTNNEGS